MVESLKGTDWAVWVQGSHPDSAIAGGVDAVAGARTKLWVPNVDAIPGRVASQARTDVRSVCCWKAYAR